MAESRTDRIWWVYLLRCRMGMRDRLYCGITTDVARRFREHLEGDGGAFTKAFPPQALVWTEGPMTHGDALRREAAVKRLTKRRKEALIVTAAPAADAGRP